MQRSYCPFVGKKCIEGKCTFFTTTKAVRPSKVSGKIVAYQARGCVFNLLLFIFSTPSLPIPPLDIKDN